MERPEGPSDEVWTCPACGLSFAACAGPTLTMDVAHTVTSVGLDSMAAGRQTIGRFEILGQIGRGGSGTVYKAYDSGLGRPVAVKVPHRGECGTQPERERFLREARNAAQLHHPAIVPIFDMGEFDGTPYIVSELIEGSSLDRLLPLRRFSFREAAEVVATVAEGLHCAHENGVVHRDVKPSNIMINCNGQPRIMDFGLARQASRDVTLTMDGQVLGTPAYMSPEQAAGRTHQIDHRSDIYSLGIVLFELLTGERPFVGNPQMMMHQVLFDDPRNPRSLNNYIPPDLETICLKAIDKDPGRRYQSAKELAEDLRRWLRAEPIHARRIGTIGHASRWCRRNPSLAVMTVLTLLLLIAVAVGSTAAFFSIASARKQEREAQVALEASLQEARHAFDQYYALVSDNPLLDEPATQPLLQQILGTAMNSCQRFLSQYGDRPDLGAEVAATYVRLALLQSASGDTDAALTTIEKAADRLERLLASRPSFEQLGPLSAGLFRFPRYARHGATQPSSPSRTVAVMVRVVAIWDRLVAEYAGVPSFEHDRAGMYYYLDLAYRAAGDSAGALRAIEKSIEILAQLVESHPENRGYKRELSQYCSVYGDVNVALGRLDSGLKQQERAATIDPSNPRPFDRIAVSLMTDRNPKRQDPLRAIEFAKKAIAVEPRIAQYWHTLGVAQYRAGKWQEALDSFDKSMVLQNGGDGLDWYFVAMAHWQLGDKNRAAQFFHNAEDWKKNEHVGPDDLEGLDHEAASLLTRADGQFPRNELHVSPKAALSH
jgi:tetratricopeptide (TPR) repeat protein